MWGAIAGIAAASLALAVLHQTLEATGLSEKKPKEQGKLPEPGPGFEKRADGKWTAPLWESASAQEALKKARRVLRK